MPDKNPQNRRRGHARVRTYGQTLGAQLEQLRAAGYTEIYREKVTGARRDQRELRQRADQITATSAFRESLASD